MNTNELSDQERTDNNPPRFSQFVAETVEETADYSHAMRDLERADNLIETDRHGIAASTVRNAAKRLNRIADRLEAEHEHKNSEGS